MSDQLSALNLFVHVARTGSFSKGARELNLSQPTASRIIAGLEEQIGATLFTRTTRAVTLTEAGEEYLARVLEILSALEEANQAARGPGDLRGSLKIGACSMFTSRAIIPHIAGFLEKHPLLRVEFQVSDTKQNMLAEALDIALPVGDLEDSTAITRRIGAWPMILVASPDYIRRRGDPTAPSDLAAHELIANAGLPRRKWSFTRDGRSVTIDLPARLSFSTGETAIDAAVAGYGLLIAMAPALLDELKSGHLVPVLPEWKLGALDMHALFPGGQPPKAAARAFADFLADTIRRLNADRPVASGHMRWAHMS